MPTYQGVKMVPAREDILIELGSGFEQIFTYQDSTGTPVNLSNYKAVAAFAKSSDSPSPFYEIGTDPWVTNGESKITLDAQGHIQIIITAGDTLLIPLQFPFVYGPFPGQGTTRIAPNSFQGKLAAWDLKLFPPTGEPFTLLQGVVCFAQGAASTIVSPS
jgi:hypothetical protein